MYYTNRYFVIRIDRDLYHTRRLFSLIIDKRYIGIRFLRYRFITLIKG